MVTWSPSPSAAEATATAVASSPTRPTSSSTACPTSWTSASAPTASSAGRTPARLALQTSSMKTSSPNSTLRPPSPGDPAEVCCPMWKSYPTESTKVGRHLKNADRQPIPATLRPTTSHATNPTTGHGPWNKFWVTGKTSCVPACVSAHLPLGTAAITGTPRASSPISSPRSTIADGDATSSTSTDIGTKAPSPPTSTTGRRNSSAPYGLQNGCGAPPGAEAAESSRKPPASTTQQLPTWRRTRLSSAASSTTSTKTTPASAISTGTENATALSSIVMEN